MFQYAYNFLSQESLFGLKLWENILIGISLILCILIKCNEDGLIDLTEWMNKMGNIEITKREFIISIAIIGIMLILGFNISENIREHNLARNEEYNQALKINNDKNMLDYGIKTNIGNAFVYGTITAVNPIEYNGVKYTSLTRIREKYTMHTRTVTTITNGRTTTRTEVYYTWDKIDEENQHSDIINIIGTEFPWEALGNNKISEAYIGTVDISTTLRDNYYASNAENTGTLYGNLGNIKNEYGATFKNFYKNEEIEEVVEELEKNYNIVWFWILWALLSGILAVGFCYMENKWLE